MARQFYARLGRRMRARRRTGRFGISCIAFRRLRLRAAFRAESYLFLSEMRV